MAEAKLRNNDSLVDCELVLGSAELSISDLRYDIHLVSLPFSKRKGFSYSIETGAYSIDMRLTYTYSY